LGVSKQERLVSGFGMIEEGVIFWEFKIQHKNTYGTCLYPEAQFIVFFATIMLVFSITILLLRHYFGKYTHPFNYKSLRQCSNTRCTVSYHLPAFPVFFGIHSPAPIWFPQHLQVRDRVSLLHLNIIPFKKEFLVWFFIVLWIFLWF
jgi:hypothetical protein